MSIKSNYEHNQDTHHFGKVLLRFKYLILAVTILGGWGGHELSMKLPVYYGYTILLESPKIAEMNKSEPVKITEMGKVGGQNAKSSFEREIANYLDFKYVELKRDFFASTTYLKEARVSVDEPTIVLTVHSPTLEEAKQFGANIVKEIIDQYQPKIDEKMKNLKNEYDINTQQLSSMEKTLEGVKSAQSSLGYSPLLLQQESEIQSSLIILKKTSLLLNTFMSESSLHNAAVKFERPVKGEPVSWPPIAVIAGCAIGAMFICINMLAFGMSLGLFSPPVVVQPMNSLPSESTAPVPAVAKNKESNVKPIIQLADALPDDDSRDADEPPPLSFRRS